MVLPQWFNAHIGDLTEELPEQVKYDMFLKPVLADVDVLHVAIDCSAHTGNHALTVSPDYPRNITLQTVDAAGNNLAGTITITGKDVRGETQTEVFTIAINVDDYVGNKAFALISDIAWDLPSSAASDTVAIGVGSKLGLSRPAVSVVKESFDGADRAVGTLNTTYNTYTSGATLDGLKSVEVWYLAGLVR
jgi:hypothetical protein